MVTGLQGDNQKSHEVKDHTKSSKAFIGPAVIELNGPIQEEE